MGLDILAKDTLATSLLVTTSMMSFITPFLKLCYELRKHCHTKKWMLLDKHKSMIMDFSEKGIENTFDLISEGVQYSIQDPMRFYQNLKPSSNLIKDWLVNNRKNLIKKAFTSNNKGEFHPSISKIIAMLSKVIK